MKINSHGYTVERTFVDYPDDFSEAAIIYFSGCSHSCDGCQNSEFQKFVPYNKEKALDDIISVSTEPPAPLTNKVVLSGGDPLFPLHFENTMWLIRHLKELDYNICIYTGFDINYVRKKSIRGVDFFKCGVYNKQLHRLSFKDDTQFVLASPNQDFYNSNYKKISNNGKLLWRKHD